MPAVEQELRRIETQCTKASTQVLQHAERLNSRLYKTTIRLVLGFRSIGETNTTMFTGVVRVHAVKMGSVHQIMEQYWQTNAKGDAERRGCNQPQLLLLSLVLAAVVVFIKHLRLPFIGSDDRQSLNFEQCFR